MFASDGVFPLREPDDTRSAQSLEQATRNRTYARSAVMSADQERKIVAMPAGTKAYIAGL
jgi:hypothetical protein